MDKRLEAPERVWIREDRYGIDLEGAYGAKPKDVDCVEYVRADLAQAAPEPTPGEGSPSHPSPRCAKCELSAWDWMDGKRICHYCRTPFPFSGPSQDSQEVEADLETVQHALRYFGGQANHGYETYCKATEAFARLRALSQSPKGGAAGLPLDRLRYFMAEVAGITDVVAKEDVKDAAREWMEEIDRVSRSESPKGGAPDRALAMETLLALACKELIRRTGSIESKGCLNWWQGKEEGLEGGGEAGGGPATPSAPGAGNQYEGMFSADGTYRKKPVVVHAFRMGIDPRPDWFQDKVTRNEIITGVAPGEYQNEPFEFSRTCCRIKTLEGEMTGDYGDWIIRGVKGEVYPCKPDIFAATYEPAAPPPGASGAGDQGRPFSLRAEVGPQGEGFDFRTTVYLYNHDKPKPFAHFVVLSEAKAQEIAYRINAFEPAPGDVGEAGGVDHG